MLHFDGPILSEFSTQRGERYLYYWTDCDAGDNRWMIFKVSENDRLRLIAGRKSLRNLMKELSDFVIFADLNSNLEPSGIWLVDVLDIPHSYFPDHDSYLTLSSVNEVIGTDSVTMLIDEEWNLPGLDKLVKCYSQVYSFIYFLKGQTNECFRNYPWQGGFSAVHFYKALERGIPLGDSIRLEKIQYASPGYIRLSANKNISSATAEAIARFNLKTKKIADVSDSLYSEIRRLGLNQQEPEDAVRGFSDSPKLLRWISELIELLDIEKEKILALTNNPFERTKIALAHHKRMKEFCDFLSSGKVRMVTDELL